MTEYVDSIEEVTIKILVDTFDGASEILEFPLVNWSKDEDELEDAISEKIRSDAPISFIEVGGAGSGWGPLGYHVSHFSYTELEIASDIIREFKEIKHWNAYCVYVALCENGYVVTERKFYDAYSHATSHYNSLEDFVENKKVTEKVFSFSKDPIDSDEFIQKLKAAYYIIDDPNGGIYVFIKHIKGLCRP